MLVGTVAPIGPQPLSHPEQSAPNGIGDTSTMRALSFVGNLAGAGLVAIGIPLVILALGIPLVIVLTVILGWLGLV